MRLPGTEHGVEVRAQDHGVAVAAARTRPHVPGRVDAHVGVAVVRPPRAHQRRAVALEARRCRDLRELDRALSTTRPPASSRSSGDRHPGGDELVHRVRAEPDLGQDLARVRAERGRRRRVRERRAIEAHGDADDAIVARVRMVQVLDRAERLGLRARRTPAPMSRTSAAGTPSASSSSSQCALGAVASTASNACVSSSRFRTRDALSANRGIVDERVGAQDRDSSGPTDPPSPHPRARSTRRRCGTRRRERTSGSASRAAPGARPRRTSSPPACPRLGERELHERRGHLSSHPRPQPFEVRREEPERAADPGADIQHRRADLDRVPTPRSPSRS